MPDLDAAIRERITLVPDLDSMGEDIRFKYDVEPIQAALLAVVDLHKPHDLSPYQFQGLDGSTHHLCMQCSGHGWATAVVLVYWPCPTVLAAPKALGVSLTS